MSKVHGQEWRQGGHAKGNGRPGKYKGTWGKVNYSGPHIVDDTPSSKRNQRRLERKKRAKVAQG
jgi:hypothetical protein